MPWKAELRAGAQYSKGGPARSFEEEMKGANMKPIVLRTLVGVALAAVLTGCAASPEARRDRAMSKGEELLEKKDYVRALLEFKNAARAIPTDAEAYYQMGLAFLGTQDIRSGYSAFRKALALNPKHSGAQLKVAQLQMQTNDPDLVKDSAARLRGLLVTKPHTPEVLSALAFTELKLGDPKNAIGTLEQALAQAPQELSAAVMLMQAKLSLNDTKGAQAVVEKAVADAPKSSAAHRLLGEFYAGQNKPAEAEQAYRKALAADAKDGQAMLDLARLELAQKRKQEAEQILGKLSEIDGYRSAHAIFLYQDGRREEAVGEFERLARENPDNRQMRTNLIIAYRTTGRADAADRVLDKALSKNPKDAEALLQRAEIAIGKRKYEQAEADLNTLLKFRPNAPEGHYVLARLNLVRGNTLTYRQQLAKALELNPELLAVRLELAQNLIAAKQASAALELMDSAPVYQRTALALVVQRNWGFWQAGNLQEMRKGIDVGLAAARTAELLVQDGFWKLRAGRPAEARSAFEEALKVDPTEIRALQGVSSSYLAQKNAAMALARVRQHAAEHPEATAVQELLGGMLLAAGKNDEARVIFQAAMTKDPKSVSADMSLVQVDMLQGKMDDAHKRIGSILARDSSNKTARQLLADIEALRGQSSPAIAHFRQVLSEDPGNAQAYNNLAYLLLDTQADEALRYAQKAVELAPDRPAYCDTLGWAMYRKGLYSGAIQYLELAASGKGAKGSASGKVDPVWMYHLAMAYAKTGDLGRGRQTLEAALRRDPNLPEAKLAQEAIGKGN
jgi:cellulose synthase operon protein C